MRYMGVFFLPRLSLEGQNDMFAPARLSVRGQLAPAAPQLPPPLESE